MKKAVFFFFLLSWLVVNAAGCVFILGGAAGAVGAYGLSKDTIEGNTDIPYENLWSQAILVCKARGSIKKEDSLQGVIEFVERDSSHVWVQLLRISQYTTQLRVSARKFHFPNLTLAQEVYLKVLEPGVSGGYSK
jgi:hypothetical protein